MQNLINAPAFLAIIGILATQACALTGCGIGNSDQEPQSVQAAQATRQAMNYSHPQDSFHLQRMHQEPNMNQVIINGTPLSTDQVNGIEFTYGIKPLPGNYWYDQRSGLYGVVGFQAYGFMLPGHNFGQLQRNASNGFSGVIVNGRELQIAEVNVLSQIWGVRVQQGSYWFDSAGNAGYEGNPVPLGNLFVAAVQNGYAGGAGGGTSGGGTTVGGGDNFWSTAFSAGNSDRGGTRGYVSVPGYGPVGYGF